jgi:alpha-tubulin suppressor-like RCC1 family protein
MIAAEKVHVPRLIAILVGMIVAFSLVLVPAEASPRSKVIAVATGHEHTCALMSSGGVKCWGFNGSNQLGVSTGKKHPQLQAARCSRSYQRCQGGCCGSPALVRDRQPRRR